MVFSMAKSIVSLIVAMAVDDGYLILLIKLQSVFSEMNFLKKTQMLHGIY